MTTVRVSEEEIDYQRLFKPPETPPPVAPELNLVDQHLKQFASQELFGPSSTVNADILA